MTNLKILTLINLSLTIQRVLGEKRLKLEKYSIFVALTFIQISWSQWRLADIIISNNSDQKSRFAKLVFLVPLDATVMRPFHFELF